MDSIRYVRLSLALLPTVLLTGCPAYIKTEIEDLNPPELPVKILRQANETRCKCPESQGMYLSNSRAKNVTVTYRTIINGGSPSDTEVSVPKEGAHFIGCTKGEEDVATPNCALNYERSVIKVVDVAQFSKAFKTLRPDFGAVATLSVSSCSALCEAGDQEHCLRLGAGAWRITKPLSDLYDSASKQQDKTIKKTEIFAAYKNDAAKDPCGRGDISIDINKSIRNEGPTQCVISAFGQSSTPNLFSKSQQVNENADMALYLPPVISGQAHSYITRDKKMAEVLSFSEATSAASIIFTGPGGAEITDSYGGRVYDVGKVNDQMVIVTEHGCLTAPAK